MEAPSAPPTWIELAKTGLQALIPIILVLTSVRLLLTDSFVRLEYGLPDFPVDRFGFTRADRVHHASIALDYLLNDDGIEFLGDQRFEDGSPVYNARELRHMEDVKSVTQAALKVRLVSLALAGGLGALIWQLAGGRAVWEVLHGGSRLTGVLMVVLAIGLLIGFTVVFVAFHRVFFAPDTWTFRFEDTLIRLFPERFWQVAFGAVALATLVQAGLLWLASKAMIGRAT